MSVYGYSISKGKTRFNINLTSAQTNDRTGALYDAFYTINLRSHLDSTDFQKEYNVYLAFESEGTSNQIPVDGIYAIHLELAGNRINSFASAELRLPHFLVFKSYTNTSAGTLFVRFDTKASDNSPLRVRSLYGLDKVGFSVFDAITNTIFDGNVNYQVTLAFEEV